MKKIGLLVGAGSVGKKHAVSMTAIFEELIVVDKEPSALEWCQNNLKKNIQVFKK